MPPLACQKRLFDKLVDGGVSPPPLPPLPVSAKILNALAALRLPAAASSAGRILRIPVRAGRACTHVQWRDCCRISGRGDCKVAIFLSENRIFIQKNQLRGRRTRRRPRLKNERAVALSRSL